MWKSEMQGAYIQGRDMITNSNLWNENWKKYYSDHEKIEALRECLLELIEELRSNHAVD